MVISGAYEKFPVTDLHALLHTQFRYPHLDAGPMVQTCTYIHHCPFHEKYSGSINCKALKQDSVSCNVMIRI